MYEATLKITYEVTGTETVGKATNPSKINYSVRQAYTSGTGDAKINAVFSEEETLAPAGSKDYDLDDDTVMQNTFETGIAFAKIKRIIIENTGANSLTISGDFLDITTDTDTVEAGGIRLYSFGGTGRTVTADSADVVTVSSSGGTTYEIYIDGEI